MNRELVLVAIALGVVVATALALLFVPGAVSSPFDPDAAGEQVPPGHVHIEEVTIAAGDVTGANATLEVDTYLRHRGNPVENVTVVHRATDSNTGLIATESERAVEALAEESETRVRGNVTVPRRSDYRIETIVYANGNRQRTATHHVEGVGSLVPDHARTDVAFRRTAAGDAGLPAIAYSVASTDGDRVTLAVSPYLTNTGDQPERDLDLEVIARQSDSNVIADTETVAVGTVGPGATTAPTVELTVPEGYDYTLDAVLWREQTAVASAQAAAAIGPGNLTVSNSTDDGGLEISDFERDAGPGGDDGSADRDENGDDATPGFGAAATLVAVLGAVALYARRDAQ